MEWQKCKENNMLWEALRKVVGGAVSLIATCLRWTQRAPELRVSPDERLPFGQRGRAAGLVGLSVGEMALLVEVVVDAAVQ